MAVRRHRQWQRGAMRLAFNNSSPSPSGLGLCDTEGRGASDTSNE